MLRFKRNDFKKFKSKMNRLYPLHSKDIPTNAQKGLISVVLPVYNGEKYLREAIDSVLTQTYPNLELIVVNDGSTDNSGKIADEYAVQDKRVRVIHQKNKTLPVALNNGFAKARGEYFTWTSADNRMLPECLEVLEAELAGDSTCDMVYGNMRLIDSNGEILRGKGWYELPPMSGNVILPSTAEKLNVVANNTIGAGFLYRSGADKVLGGYSEYKFTLEDYDYFMRMNSLFTIRHILYKKPVYEYRMHKESLTARDKELGITDSRPALMELDAQRRKFYLKPTYIYIEGENKELEQALTKYMPRVYSKKTAKYLASCSPPRLAFITLPPCLPLEGKVGFAKQNSDEVSLDPQTYALTLTLAIKNQLLYQYEKKIHNNGTFPQTPPSN